MKIKSNLKRTVSVLLAVMLLAATAIPMSLFSVSAASEEEIAQAVEAVKTAWGKVKGERIQLDFHNYVDINKGEHVVSGTDTIVTKYDSVPSDLPATITKTEFGNEYYKLATESGSSQNPYTTAFRFSYPSAITENNLTIGDVASIDFCYKIENNKNTWGGFFNIGFNTHDIWFWDASRKTGWMPFTTSWKHVSLALDSNTDWDTAAPWKNKDGEINLASVTNNTLASDKYFFVSLSENFKSEYVQYFYLGGVFLQFKPQIPDISSKSALDIIKTYYETDFSKYTNTEPLAAAITDLCAAMGADAVDIVKDAVETAWNNVKGERIPLNFAYYAQNEQADPA
ncbi:MAG: hypothetical protein UHO61_04420, partial [Acutalibacteraceae bacterium]|nr:hypothetical protein [Acutalibacteraceae bacterium]